MTAQQCAERQAARDNLVCELIDALEFALGEWAGWCDYGGGSPLEATDEYQQIAEILRRAKEQA